jgi:hypothetical protein
MYVRHLRTAAAKRSLERCAFRPKKEIVPHRTPAGTDDTQPTTNNDDNERILTLFPTFLSTFILTHQFLISRNHSFLFLFASTTNGLKSCNGRGGTSLSPRFAVNSWAVVSLTTNDSGLCPHLFNPRSRKWYFLSPPSQIKTPN